MKKILFVICILSLILSCNKPKNKADFSESNIKKITDSILTNWHLAATNANFENYFDTMDSVSVFIGTDATENWTKEQFANFSKPYFDKGKAWDFKTLERNIYVSKTGDFVWFDELLNTWMGTCRGSGVLEKSDENWKIKHYVLSIAIPNDAVQKVILAKKENDSIFLKKFE